MIKKNVDEKKRHDASNAHVSFPIFPSLACFSTVIASKQTKKKNNPKWKRWIQQICQLGQHVRTAAKIQKNEFGQTNLYPSWM